MKRPCVSLIVQFLDRSPMLSKTSPLSRLCCATESAVPARVSLSYRNCFRFKIRSPLLASQKQAVPLKVCSLWLKYRRVVGIEGDALETIIGIAVTDRSAVNINSQAAVVHDLPLLDPYPRQAVPKNRNTRRKDVRRWRSYAAKPPSRFRQLAVEVQAGKRSKGLAWRTVLPPAVRTRTWITIDMLCHDAIRVRGPKCG